MLREALRRLWWRLTGAERAPDGDSCEALELFADGELPPEAAEDFRGHLVACARCQQGLLDHLQLEALAERATRLLREVAMPVHCAQCGEAVKCGGCGTPVFVQDVAGKRAS